jgi:UPF0176 protein
MTKNNFEVLLYYKYVNLESPKRIMREQKKLCEELKLKGRIIVSTEGINGTLEGKRKNTQKYIDEMGEIPEFFDISYKRSTGTGKAFPKLSVKIRPELVSAYMPELNPNDVTGKYISSEELHDWYLNKKEFYLVDMRNDYEYESGHFKGTIFSDFSNFRDLPKIVEKLKDMKDKTIVTVCTGGVRCEKASGFLVENGFSDVYQLKDGIQTYMENYPNEHFLGKLYVFDNRLTFGVNIDSPDHVVVGVCRHCKGASDHYVNCELNTCHRHYISCENCIDETGFYFCSKKCKESYLSTFDNVSP